MAEFIDNHIGYLLHQAEIEKMRQLHEESYRESDPTAQAVMVLDGSDADRYPAIQRLKADGYHLIDAFAFGFDDEVTGEIQIFSRK
jgi:hypothetical protein